MAQLVHTVTDATPDYDYPATVQLLVLGRDVRTGREIRLVGSPAHNVGYQRDRYRSGYRMAMTESEFARIEDIALAPKPGVA